MRALKERKDLQARLEKPKPQAIQREIADLHEELARKSRIAVKEREIAEASSSQGTSLRSISPFDSFTEDSGCRDKSESAKNGTKFNIAVSVHSTPENTVKLVVQEGKFSTPMRDSKPPTVTAERDD